MDIRQIRDFVAVVRSGSFAAASRRLHLSQPGLGYQIKELELELGVELLTRHSRGVALTAAGAIFLEHAEVILTAIRQAKESVAALAEAQHREISIGLSPTPAQLLGPKLMELTTTERGLKLRLHEALSGELHAEVASGNLDLAICLEDSASKLRSIPMYREYLYLIGRMNADAKRRDAIPLVELANYPLVIAPRPHVPRTKLESVAAERGVTLNVEQELETGGLRRSLVMNNGRYTVAAFGIFADEIEKGHLHAQRIVDPEITMSVNVICSASLSPQIETLIVSTIRSLVSTMPMVGNLA